VGVFVLLSKARGAVVSLSLVSVVAFAPPATSQGLPVIGMGPEGPICAGPRGPAPCAVIQQWMTQQGQMPPNGPPMGPPRVRPCRRRTGWHPRPQRCRMSDRGHPRRQIALACAQARGTNVAGFVECTGAQVILPQTNHAVLECAVSSRTNENFAVCAADKAGIRLTRDQRILANCAMRSKGDEDEFTDCAKSIVGNYLTKDQQAVLSCAEDASSSSDFASCAARRLIGPRLSKEQRIAVECAANSGGDYQQFAVCAGDEISRHEPHLNAEQQIAVQCVVSTGGQPYAAAGCMVTRWTARELEKCFQNGFWRRRMLWRQ